MRTLSLHIFSFFYFLPKIWVQFVVYAFENQSGLNLADEQYVVEKLKENHEKTQRGMYEKYFGLFMSIAMRYANCWDDGMDIVNQSFLKIFTKVADFKSEGSFEGWMKRIVTNTALDYVKLQKNPTVELEQVIDTKLENYSNDLIDKYDAEEIIMHIQQLPPATRAVFNLYALEGYSHKEIAIEMNISEGTSHWHLSTAKKILIERMQLATVKKGGLHG